MVAASQSPGPSANRGFYAFNAVLSTAALGFLAYLLLFREAGDTGLDLRFLPAVNAGLNATAASLLVAGWVAIRRKRPDVHRYLMVSAFAASVLFLLCYVAYHYAHGDTRFAGSGPIRVVYLLILASHVILSMAVVPLCLTTFWFAFRRSFERHRKVARITLPIWLYVSVTGVAIFALLRTYGA